VEAKAGLLGKGACTLATGENVLNVGELAKSSWKGAQDARNPGIFRLATGGGGPGLREAREERADIGRGGIVTKKIGSVDKQKTERNVNPMETNREQKLQNNKSKGCAPGGRHKQANVQARVKNEFPCVKGAGKKRYFRKIDEQLQMLQPAWQ